MSVSARRSITHLLSSARRASEQQHAAEDALKFLQIRQSIKSLHTSPSPRDSQTADADKHTANPKHTIHITDEIYNRQRSTLPLLNRIVHASPSAYIAPSAVCVGDVDIFERVRIYHNVVIRGDLNSIRIGAHTTVGDRSVIHAATSSPTGLPAATNIGQNVLVGQGCLLRSVNIGDGCVVGDKSILLEGSRMEGLSVLEPSSVVPPGRVIPSGQVWGGSPAAFVRNLTKDEKMDVVGFAEREGLVADAYYGEGIDGQGEGAWVAADKLRAGLKDDCGVKQGGDLQGISDRALGSVPTKSPS